VADKGSLLTGFLLALSLALLGFPAGVWLAGLAGAGQGQGLAAGAIVIFWGLCGAVAGGVGGLLLWRWVSSRTLRRLLLVAGPPALLIAVLLVAGVFRSRSDMRAHLQEAYERLPAFRLELIPGPAAGARPLDQFTADWEERSFSYTAGGQRCSAPLNGAQAVQLLTALRNAEGVLYRDPAPCPATAEAPVYRLRFTIREAKPPETVGNIALTPTCLSTLPALGEPHSAAEALLAAAGDRADCRGVDQRAD
jgi:hypothetical protein